MSTERVRTLGKVKERAKVAKEEKPEPIPDEAGAAVRSGLPLLGPPRAGAAVSAASSASALLAGGSIGVGRPAIGFGGIR